MTTEALAKNIRRDALLMTSRGGSSHIGSILSIADILAVLYGKVLKIDPNAPRAANRDRFILSKGHAGGGVYAALAEVEFFPKEKLMTHYRDGSDLSGHISHKGIPGVEISTGSLGHGLSVACGMAYACKEEGSARAFCLMSDGECDEGSNWEAILFAAHHELDNLVVNVDYNKLQSLTTIEKTLKLEPFAEKWEKFGWSVLEVKGHNHDELQEKFSHVPIEKGKPSCFIAHTTKGKGVSFMENQVLWHYRTARDEELTRALAEIEGAS